MTAQFRQPELPKTAPLRCCTEGRSLPEGPTAKAGLAAAFTGKTGESPAPRKRPPSEASHGPARFPGHKPKAAFHTPLPVHAAGPQSRRFYQKAYSGCPIAYSANLRFS